MKSVLSVLLALACSVSLWGQADANKGQIAGTVFDPNQAVVPAAAIAIKNAATGATRDLMSNEVGEFRAVLVDPGSYEVRVNKPGFAEAVFRDVVVPVG